MSLTTDSDTSPIADPRVAGPGATIRAAVLGATGFTGGETCRILSWHPSVHLDFAGSSSKAGRSLCDVVPRTQDLILQPLEALESESIDVAFLALPHGAGGRVASDLVEGGVRVIDLSGDHRLTDAKLHENVYGTERSDALAEEAVYGLTEFARDALPRARFVANPGCYATSVELALAPLAQAGLLRGTVVVDSKSGVSGAGRTPTETTHFSSVSGDVRPYRVGRCHRHVPEMEQFLAGKGRPAEFRLIFTPHLVPLDRGILSTIVLTGTALSSREVRDVLASHYAGEPFVRTLREGGTARIGDVVLTNGCVLSVHEVEETDAVVITSAIDNLQKGAAGQAVHNMNLMFGLPETAGLVPLGGTETGAAPSTRSARRRALELLS